MSIKLHVVSPPVAKVAVGFAAIAKEIGPDLNIEYSVHSTVPNVGINIKNAGQEIENDVNFKQFVVDLTGRPHIHCNSGFVKTQHPQTGRASFEVRFKVDDSQNYFTVESVSDRPTALKIMDLLHEHFRILSRAEVLMDSLPEDAKEAIRFREEAVQSLEGQVNRLGGFLTQMMERNAEQVRALTTDLEKQFQAKQAAADARIAKQQEEVEIARKEFEKAKADFDDRQRTHVRRDLLKKIQENIDMRRNQSSLITSAASRSRLLIHITSWFFICLAGYFTFVAGKHLYDALGKPPFDWRVVPPFSFLALFLVGILIFYFRWTSRWSDVLAHNDLAIAQYASDILRASWIAELLFEVKEDQQKEIPPEVLASLTEGLFKRDPLRPGKYHPSDDVLATLKKVQSFKAGPQGVELITRAK
jgi:hypothetical protein